MCIYVLNYMFDKKKTMFFSLYRYKTNGIRRFSKHLKKQVFDQR